MTRDAEPKNSIGTIARSMDSLFKTNSSPFSDYMETRQTASSLQAKNILHKTSLCLDKENPCMLALRAPPKSRLSKLPLPLKKNREPVFDFDPLSLNATPPSLGLKLTPKLRPSTTGSVDNPFLQPGKSHKTVRKDSIEAKTCKLALKNRLSLSEVKRIMREFGSAAEGLEGISHGLDRAEFDRAMCRIFDVESVDDDIAENAYNASGGRESFAIESFFDWYVQNMFTKVSKLNCAKDKVASEMLMYDMALRHNVAIRIIDKAKVKFDLFDTDKSGDIDFEEFTEMMRIIMKTRTDNELCPERVKRFWKEIDANSDGGVSFEEFATWYLKYFTVEEEGLEEMDTAGPLQAFYDSFDPRVQRRASLNSLEHDLILADAESA